ncbi:MAG: hypothetical protein ACRCXN_07450 [Bacteroidales bacterium]
MENFTPVSRELTNSSLWRSLAGTEAKILIDLLALAPFKATSYTLYGVDIQLEKHELCFSCVKMAEKYGISEYVFKRYLNKLVEHGLVEKRKRKLVSTSCSTIRTGKRTTIRTSTKLSFVTSITFCGWVFGENEKSDFLDNDALPSASPSAPSYALHNKELIKEEEKKEENLYKHNACEDKNEFLKKTEKPKKIWYPIEQIEKVEFPNAERILYAWQKFSGQTNVQIIPLLRQYCKEQKDIDILQMTLDVLDYRFRKYMKQHFKISKQVVEPVRRTNYIRIEE